MGCCFSNLSWWWEYYDNQYTASAWIQHILLQNYDYARREVLVSFHSACRIDIHVEEPCFLLSMKHAGRWHQPLLTVPHRQQWVATDPSGSCRLIWMDLETLWISETECRRRRRGGGSTEGFGHDWQYLEGSGSYRQDNETSISGLWSSGLIWILLVTWAYGSGAWAFGLGAWAYGLGTHNQWRKFLKGREQEPSDNESIKSFF